MPLVLLTMSLLELQGTAVPDAPVMVQVTVPVGWPAPGDAAATMAEKLAAFDVTVGFVLALMVTAEGDLSTVWVSSVAVEPVMVPLSPK